MSERLEYLIETVNNSDYFTSSRNKKNWSDEMKTKMTTLVLSKKLIDISNDMDVVDETDDEEEGLTQSQRKDSKVEIFQAIRESDSIRRAMTDLYRRSKLLNNFAIMNSTGFIKIIKKFDKTFPLRKGMFKEVTQNGYICDDGKEISALSDKMVSPFRSKK